MRDVEAREIYVQQGNILEFEVVGLMVPTNSEGRMSEGLSLRVKEAIGPSVEVEVREHTPFVVGSAMVTEAGGLPVQRLVHAPINEKPGMKIGVESIRRATRASLLAASKFEMESISIPGIGLGPNGIAPEEAARAIIDEIHGFRAEYPKQIYLIDDDNDMIEAFAGYSKAK